MFCGRYSPIFDESQSVSSARSIEVLSNTTLPTVKPYYKSLRWSCRFSYLRVYTYQVQVVSLEPLTLLPPSLTCVDPAYLCTDSLFLCGVCLLQHFFCFSLFQCLQEQLQCFLPIETSQPVSLIQVEEEIQFYTSTFSFYEFYTLRTYG